jgi:hypothetical protein
MRHVQRDTWNGPPERLSDAFRLTKHESAFGPLAIAAYLLFGVTVLFVAAAYGGGGVTLTLFSAIVWSTLSFVLGKRKDRPVRGLLLGLVLGPLGLLVVALQD